jgi:hypothetical protein
MKDAEEAANIKYPCSDTCQCRKQSSKERPLLGEITNNLGPANKKVGGFTSWVLSSWVHACNMIYYVLPGCSRIVDAATSLYSRVLSCAGQDQEGVGVKLHGDPPAYQVLDPAESRAGRLVQIDGELWYSSCTTAMVHYVPVLYQLAGVLI